MDIKGAIKWQVTVIDMDSRNIPFSMCMLQEFDKSSENVSIYFLLTYLSEFFKDHEADRSNMIRDMSPAHFVKWFE